MAQRAGSYTLSSEADADVEQIARDSLEKWGLPQVERYISGMHESFERLSEFPRMGRDASGVRNGYKRMEVGSHVVFYLRRGADILIVRVLHQRMLHESYL